MLEPHCLQLDSSHWSVSNTVGHGSLPLLFLSLYSCLTCFFVFPFSIHLLLYLVPPHNIAHYSRHFPYLSCPTSVFVASETLVARGLQVPWLGFLNQDKGLDAGYSKSVFCECVITASLC